MKDPAIVEFVIRLSDLRKAMKHLSVNRGEFRQSDYADLIVSPCIAVFRAVGTEIEVPINDIRTGGVRIPLRLFRDLVSVAPTFKKRELKIHFEEGKAQIEKWIRSHPDICIGIFPDQKFDLPADATALDTLAMASLLSPEQIVDQGLRERVETAQRYTSEAISNALVALREFRISRNQIQQLLDIQVREMAAQLKLAMVRPQ